MNRVGRRTLAVERAIDAAGGRPVPGGEPGEWVAVRWKRRNSKGHRVIFGLPMGVAAWQLTALSTGYEKVAVAVTRDLKALSPLVEYMAHIPSSTDGRVRRITKEEIADITAE